MREDGDTMRSWQGEELLKLYYVSIQGEELLKLYYVSIGYRWLSANEE